LTLTSSPESRLFLVLHTLIIEVKLRPNEHLVHYYKYNQDRFVWRRQIIDLSKNCAPKKHPKPIIILPKPKPLPPVPKVVHPPQAPKVVPPKSNKSEQANQKPIQSKVVAIPPPVVPKTQKPVKSSKAEESTEADILASGDILGEANSLGETINGDETALAAGTDDITVGEGEPAAGSGSDEKHLTLRQKQLLNIRKSHLRANNKNSNNI
jgi:hypothetical protein